MKHSLYLALLVLLMGSSSEIFANQHGPCKHDADLYCPKQKWGRGDVFRCLFNTDKAITPVCELHLNQMLEADKICKKDMDTLCADVAYGKSEKSKCLKAKREQVSPACRKEIGI